MKTTGIMTIWAIAIAIFISGCSKNSHDDLAYNASAKMPDPTVIGMVKYTLFTELPDQNAAVHWSSGYITANNILFNGTHVLGNASSMDQYPGNAAATLKLSGTGTLGTVNVPYNQFDYVSFAVSLAPNSETHALFLNGFYNKNNERIPVMIIVDQQLNLTSEWLSDRTINKQMYLATLHLNLAGLMNGVDLGTVSGIAMSNHTITISANSNVNLYQIILNNLQPAMKAEFNALPPQAAPTPVATENMVHPNG